MTQQTTATFDLYNYAHMVGAGWFALKNSFGFNLYRVTGHDGMHPTIENWQGEDITMSWFVSSTHLRTPELGHDWEVAFIPTDVAKDGVVIKPRKLRQYLSGYAFRAPTIKDIDRLRGVIQ